MLKPILHTLSIWIVVIPFLIGIMNFKGLNRDSRWIFFLVAIALIPQLMTAFVKNDGPIFNVTYNLYTPVEFAILFAVFISKFVSASTRRMLYLSVAIYTVISVYFFVNFGVEEKFLGGLVCVNNTVYMLWILLLLKQEYAADHFIIDKHNPFTWYFISIIIYAPCTVATFAIYHYIRESSNSVLKNLSVIQDVFNVLLYLLFSVGLLIRKA